MRKAATTEEYMEQWDRFEAAQKRLWHRLRRHGWRIERSDPSILWYRGDQCINVWFDWLSMTVHVELERWSSVPVEEGYALRKVRDNDMAVSFEDFENGNYSIQEVL